MNLALKPHPKTATPAVLWRVHTDIEWTATDLEILYLVEGQLAALMIPKLSTDPGRRDGLWRGTCFEFFIKGRGIPAYLEFNFSPSTEWALYRFDDYRDGMTSPPVETLPSIQPSSTTHRFELHTRVPRTLIHPFLDASSLQEVSLTAVLSDTEGNLSYWASCHASSEPDFHHPESFLPLI